MLTEEDITEADIAGFVKQILSGEKLWTNTGSFKPFGLRNGAIVSLFYDFWGPKRLLCTPKTGRKLLLGKKSTPMVIKMSQAYGQQKEQI